MNTVDLSSDVRNKMLTGTPSQSPLQFSVFERSDTLLHTGVLPAPHNFLPKGVTSGVILHFSKGSGTVSGLVLVLVGPHLPDPAQLCHLPELLQFPHLNPQGSQQGVPLGRAFRRVGWVHFPLQWAGSLDKHEQLLLSCSLQTIGHISHADGRGGATSILFLSLSCPLGWTIIASSQTDIIGLLPPKKKSKRKGFLHKLFSNPGREKKIRDLERALGGLAVQEPALPCGEPTEPQPMLQRLCAPKRGTGRAWQIEQLGAQIGAGQPQGWDATAAWCWHRKCPPSGHAGPFMQSGHLRVWCWLLSSRMWPGAVAIAYHQRGRGMGGLLLNPRFR